MKGTDKKNFSLPERLQLKTYSHLSKNKKIPNEYELVSSNMLYYFEKRGFEISTPISEWYDVYQKNSLILPLTLDQFVDPKETTYALYIQRQKDKELVLDANFRHIENTRYDSQLDEQWVVVLSQLLAPLRYPWHGFQMISSYLGSMAPEGKVAIVFAFQTMDEMRRIQRIAYRMKQLQLIHPSFGIHSLADWQHAPYWQPLRRVIELLLVTYDWMEGFVALNLCLKPILDHLLLIEFSNLAQKQGDPQLGIMFHSFWEDACWHRQWSLILVELIMKENVSNKDIVQNWINKWMSELVPALLALKPIFMAENDPYQTVFTAHSDMLDSIGLHGT